MADPHLWIPAERTRTERVEPPQGGDTYHREDVEGHSQRLLDAFSRSLAAFEGKQDLDLATELVVEISTAVDRPISKERQHLRNLGFELLSISPVAPNVGVATLTRRHVDRFQQKLQRYARTAQHVGRSNFSAIETITPVSANLKVDPQVSERISEQSTNCLITVYAGLPDRTKQAVVERIAATLVAAGKTSVQVHRFDNGVAGVSADLSKADVDTVTEQFMFVRTVELNAELVIESAVPAEPLPALVALDPVGCEMPVVIIDSGINPACPLFAGLVTEVVNHLPAGSARPHFAHGTFVASRAIFGDDVASIPALRRAKPWVRTIDVQVTGDDGIGNALRQTPTRLAEIVQHVVPALAGRSKVFNISLGVAPVLDRTYSTIARLIDFLSREHQVLFVIAAGNIDRPSAEPPRHYLAADSRILSPAESVLAVTVGSMARRTDAACVAREGEVTPYSRRGPGADGARKPDVVAHGGNVIFNGVGAPWATTPIVAAYGIGRAGTHLEYSTGTSHAAPLVAQYAARLFDAYPDASPNLVKALLCHFAKGALTPEIEGDAVDRSSVCGFGEPDIDRALFSAQASSTFLYQGEIERDTYLYIPFFVPQALVDGAERGIRIRATVAFDAPVSTDDAVNYCLCRISGKLRKQTEDGLRDVAVGGDGDDAYQPWSPLIHFSQSFRRSYAAGEWELRLRLMTRGDLPHGFRQSFAAVIEVLDAGGNIDVRKAILDEFPVYVAVQLNIAA